MRTKIRFALGIATSAGTIVSSVRGASPSSFTDRRPLLDIFFAHIARDNGLKLLVLEEAIFFVHAEDFVEQNSLKGRIR